MKIVISAQAPDLDALVDPRLARAPWLIAFESESGTWSAHAIEGKGDRSAGLAVAQRVLELKADVVVSGNVGPNAHHALTSRGVDVCQAGNGVTVREAVDALAHDSLRGLPSPTVAGGWS